MGKRDETIEVGEMGHSTGQVLLPWLLFLAAVGGAGYGYVTLHRPLADEGQRKNAAILDLTRMVSDAKRELDVAKASAVDLKKTEVELQRVRDELARSAAQKAEDGKLLDQLKKEVGAGGAE